MKIKNKYSFSTKIYLAYCLVRTKIICRKARIIRFPFELRGKEYIDLGRALTTGVGCRFEAWSESKIKRIIFGSNVQLNDYVHISAMENVYIGDNTLMASNIYISDNQHGNYILGGGDSPLIPPTQRNAIIKPVKIGRNCWLGESVIVMPGVTIGEGCIIGAHSIVNRDIPNYSMAVGSPAKVIKQFSHEKKCWINV